MLGLPFSRMGPSVVVGLGGDLNLRLLPGYLNNSEGYAGTNPAFGVPRKRIPIIHERFVPGLKCRWGSDFHVFWGESRRETQ